MMSQLRMKTRSFFVLSSLGLALVACQVALDLDSFEFDEPMMEAPYALPAGGGGASPDGMAGYANVGEAPANPGGSTGNGGTTGNSYAGIGGSGPTGMGGSSGGMGGSAPSQAAGGTGQGGAGQGGTGPDMPPPPVACTGCVELIVQVSEGGDLAVFEFTFPAPGLDFTGGVVQWRVQALSADPQLSVKVFVQNDGDNSFAGLFTEPALPLSSAAMQTMTLNVASFSPDTQMAVGAAPYVPPDGAVFDKAQVVRVGLELGARGMLDAPTELRLLVDEVTFTGVDGIFNRGFATDADGLELNTFSSPAGSQIIYHEQY